MNDRKQWIRTHESQPLEGLYVEARWTSRGPGPIDGGEDRVGVARRSSDLQGGWWYLKSGIEVLPPALWRHLRHEEPDICVQLQCFYDNADCDENLSVILEAKEEILSLIEKQRWIPVSQELPEVGDEVLGWQTWVPDTDWTQGVFLCQCRENGEWRTEDYDLLPNITHWQEAPQGPETET
jgi:hypothetical protein